MLSSTKKKHIVFERFTRKGSTNTTLANLVIEVELV